MLYRRSQARESLGLYTDAVEDLKHSMNLMRSSQTHSARKEMKDIEIALSRVVRLARTKVDSEAFEKGDYALKEDPCVEKNVIMEAKQMKGLKLKESFVTETGLNGTEMYISSGLLPSRMEQREIIVILLKQSQNSSGEAFFLINLQWWKQWCKYVNFFFDNEYHSILKSGMSMTQDDKKKLELKRREAISWLPIGAVIPQNEESNSLNSGYDDSDSSSLSEVGSDCGDHLRDMIPGIIDNSALIEENGLVCNDCPNTEIIVQKGDIQLRPNLVRGHHFEIIPRLVIPIPTFLFQSLT